MSSSVWKNAAVVGGVAGIAGVGVFFCLYTSHGRSKGEAPPSPSSAERSNVAPRVSLAPGVVVTIGGCSCRILTQIGKGSFGAVWSAELNDVSGQQLSAEVAVKEICCRSQADLASATYEGQLLRQLAEHVPPNRIPIFVTSENEHVGSGQQIVRLAMSKLPGLNLDDFFEKRGREAGPLQNADAQQADFAKACNFAWEMVKQISEAFEGISRLAYHRDINSHNVLVDTFEESTPPRFGLVDFGLAVDLTRWRGPFGPTSWHLANIGGDCRYWPMGAWLQFVCGWQELSKCPPLLFEYQAQLDFHALGLTALQALVGLLPDTDDAAYALPEEVRTLQVVWKQYWEDAHAYWQKIYDVFMNGGDINALKEWCLHEGVYNVIGQRLSTLRVAIRLIGELCQQQEAFAARGLFNALLELVSAGGVVGVEDGARTSNWELVKTLLGEPPTVDPSQTQVSGSDGALASGGGEMSSSTEAKDQAKRLSDFLSSPAVSPEVGGKAPSTALDDFLNSPDEALSPSSYRLDRQGSTLERKGAVALDAADAPSVSWMPDENATECCGCGLPFGMIRWKHHCRYCGQVFCDACSRDRLTMPGYDKPQRVCVPCGKILSGEVAGADDDDQDWNAVSFDKKGGERDGALEEIMRAMIADGHSVLTELPSYEITASLKSSADHRFVTEVPSAALWQRSFGTMLTGGRWGFSRKADVKKAFGGEGLSKLQKPLARRVYARAYSESILFNFPVEIQGGGAWRPDNMSTLVGGVYHRTLAYRLPLAAGPGSMMMLTPEPGNFLGTSCLHSDDEMAKGELLSSCLVQIFGGAGPMPAEDAKPSFVLGRHGRVDTEAKAQQLSHLISMAFEEVPHVGRISSVSRKSQKPVRRVRVLSLLNGIHMDQKELGFFRGQLAALTTSNEPMGSAGSATKRRNSATVQRHSQPQEQVPTHAFTFHAASDSPPEAFDFPAAMSALGAEFSYLNFVINWPLGMRLGVAPPQGQHNSQHPRGLRQHFQWLAGDVADALAALPEEMQLRGKESGMSVIEHIKAMGVLCSGDSSVDPWTQGLSRVRKAIGKLKDKLTSPLAKAGPEERENCNRLAMAAELLSVVAAGHGSNFRRRAAELLQLCVLEHLLGVIPFFNCKSGIDRCGAAVALWTTFHQLVAEAVPSAWLWFYAALCYPLLLKTAHQVDGCGEKRQVPAKQARDEAYLTPESALPFPPEGSDSEGYALAKEFVGLWDSKSKSKEVRAFEILESLFFGSPTALLPSLQTGYLANQLGITAKVACASTGIHGLKYGPCGGGNYNAIAAQFMPQQVRCAEDGSAVALTQVKKGYLSSDVAFADEALPYFVGSAGGRGT